MTEDEMLQALGVDLSPEPEREYSKKEERIIAWFEDIQRFVETHDHAPRKGTDGDIFERLYAVRLDRLCQLDEARELLRPLDYQGLLDAVETPADIAAMSEDELLAALQPDTPAENDITILRHVRSSQERKAAEEVATRQYCKDFEQFQPLFDEVKQALETGKRTTCTFGKDTSVSVGDFFILSGLTLYIAQVGERFRAPNGEWDARLRVIFSNSTESNLLRRSLLNALYKDEAARRIIQPDLGPLFSDQQDDGDIKSGTIYVLRSHSTEPFVAEHRELIHKIGVTGGKIETRIANAKQDATYMLADVEIVATYQLSNINRSKFEHLLHRIFSPARLDITINDRFGHPVKPREWFLVPLPVLDEAINKILDGTITNFEYDPKTAQLVSHKH